MKKALSVMVWSWILVLASEPFGWTKVGEFVKDVKLNPDKVVVQGWNPYFTIGANVNFSHNRKVVGQQDGQAWTVGASINTGVDYNNGSHQWLTNLSILDTFNYAPPINEFVEASDSLALHSEYYYRIPKVSWLGPFIDFKLETSLFEGEDVRSGYDNKWAIDGQIIHKGGDF
jgi:hypothetical protein